jgi:hypothetical protein
MLSRVLVISNRIRIDRTRKGTRIRLLQYTHWTHISVHTLCKAEQNKSRSQLLREA